MIKNIIFLITCFILSGCFYTTDLTDAGKQFTLKRDRYLISSMFGYTLAASNNTSGYGGLTPAKVVGVVPAGTHYITNSHNVYFLWSRMEPDTSYTITSGAFKGITARGLNENF